MERDSLNISSIVPAYETGPDNRMHCHWLMCRMQEAATAHADREGFGIEYMAGLNCFWVLTSMRIELKELPEREKLFSLTTWSQGAKRLRAFRDFLGCDENGCEIIKASSEWMVLDSQTRKPINVDDRINLVAKDETVFTDKIKRLRPGIPVKELRTLNVPYSSLDANGHVNNTEYLRWSIDTLRNQGLAPDKISSIRIGFLSEVFEGDTIKIMDCNAENGGFEIVGFNETKDRAAFALEVQ
ncbi:acyl-[acyl-carrier-protein] thioesterase [Maridesulfovibrio zosterae]|uniref:acyl-[acyl-carrier-protein] thioesterase n=1 Tax=Maridesulfovibrio zosterae TaxID=82171 RepID=UPI0004211D87|nr:acyl-ACP thioesterase domain-containing protein [Maridesulfovibrio zosterae]